MTVKKDEPTFRAERKPDAIMDATPKAPPVDPTQCQCIGVERRWDGDGLIEPGKYRCSVCGKWYA
jgi:hypothetical protein